MDGITETQRRNAKLWETTERKNTALVQVLKQACSRNKAIEKQQLWEQKDREDQGSAASISLKSRDGDVRVVAKVPRGAKVTANDTNKYAEERAKNAEGKEDTQLDRFCDGNDVAWRPDTFFTEVCGQDDVPPWPIRPTELFTNPHIVMKIMAQQMEKKKQKKLEKKQQKEAQKEAQKKSSSKKGKKEKKGKKGKKHKDKKESKGKKKKKDKQKKEKAKASKAKKAGSKRKKDDSDSSSDSSASSASSAEEPPKAKARPASKSAGDGAAADAGSEERAASAESCCEAASSSSSAGSEEAPDWDQ